MDHNAKHVTMRISKKTILINFGLAAVKLAAGVAVHSHALISDAAHTASDVLSPVIVMVGVSLAAREPSKQYPYGHERLESVAALILSALLCVTGLGIGATGIQALFDADHVLLHSHSHGVDDFGFIAMGIAALSIIVKEGMFWYTRAAARKLNSGSLMAVAWHNRADALLSVGSFIGIFGLKIGISFLDPLVSVVICGFILHAAFEIFSDAVYKVTDRPADDETVKEIFAVIAGVDGVADVAELKTRVFGANLFAEAVVRVNRSVSFAEADRIAANAEKSVEATFHSVKRCVVKARPAETGDGTESTESC